MKQEKRGLQEKSKRIALDRLCSMSGLLLSIACCVALIHVEFRIQDQQRMISQTTTVCDQMETKILRKLQQKYKQWGDMAGENWQKQTGELFRAFCSRHAAFANHQGLIAQSKINTLTAQCPSKTGNDSTFPPPYLYLGKL